MGLPDGYIRKGIPCYFQLDHDAWAMLKELSPTQKSYGRYLSELVRRDYIRNTEWQHRQAALARVRDAS